MVAVGGGEWVVQKCWLRRSIYTSLYYFWARIVIVLSCQDLQMQGIGCHTTDGWESEGSCLGQHTYLISRHISCPDLNRVARSIMIQAQNVPPTILHLIPCRINIPALVQSDKFLLISLSSDEIMTRHKTDYNASGDPEMTLFSQNKALTGTRSRLPMTLSCVNVGGRLAMYTWRWAK